MQGLSRCSHPDVVLLYFDRESLSLNLENSLFDLNLGITRYQMARERERPTYILFPHFV